MARVSDGCVTLHLSAALVKFSSLAVARKYLTCCISIAAVYLSLPKFKYVRICDAGRPEPVWRRSYSAAKFLAQIGDIDGCSHAMRQKNRYSTTSSSIERHVAGMETPSVLA